MKSPSQYGTHLPPYSHPSIQHKNIRAAAPAGARPCGGQGAEPLNGGPPICFRTTWLYGRVHSSSWAGLGSPSCNSCLHGKVGLHRSWEQPAHPPHAPLVPHCPTPNPRLRAPLTAWLRSAAGGADSCWAGEALTPAHPPTHATGHRHTLELRVGRFHGFASDSARSINQSIIQGRIRTQSQ